MNKKKVKNREPEKQLYWVKFALGGGSQAVLWIRRKKGGKEDQRMRDHNGEGTFQQKKKKKKGKSRSEGAPERSPAFEGGGEELSLTKQHQSVNDIRFVLEVKNNTDTRNP